MSRVPSDAPLDMVIAIVQAKCRLKKYIFGGTPGGIVAQDFRRSFRTEFFRFACSQAIDGIRCPPAGGPGVRGQPVCARPDSCPVPLVFPARSATAKKDLAPVVQVWIQLFPPDELEVRLVLLGKQATTHRTSVERVIERLGSNGILVVNSHSSPGVDPSRRIQFKAGTTLAYEGTLRHYAHCLMPAILPTAVVVEFSSPCVVARKSKASAPDANSSLAEIVGNMAYDLAVADLEDRALASTLGRACLDAAGERARREAEAAIRGLTIEASCLAPADWGRLRSGTNPGVVELSGFNGFLRLSGDLRSAAPWLAALTLRGAGQKRSYGAGEVRLWWPTVPPTAA